MCDFTKYNVYISANFMQQNNGYLKYNFILIIIILPTDYYLLRMIQQIAIMK